MQKSTLKEPVYLTKLKRRAKNIEHSLDPRPTAQQNIAYDLQVRQDALGALPKRQIYYKDERLLQEQFSNRNRSQSSTISFLGNRQAKQNALRTADACESSLFKNMSQYLSVGGKLSFEIDDRKTQNAILDQPQLLNLKARAIRTINNCKADVLKQVKLFQAHNIEQNSHKNNRKAKDSMNETSKSIYQQRIIELQQRNAQLESKVIDLQQKLKQKENVEVRIFKVEKDLNQLLLQNMQLHKMNESLLTKSQIRLNRLQTCIQTDYFPRFVQDSFCQTSIPQPQPRFSISQLKCPEQSYEGLLNRAKIWKNELQRQRVAAFNRETQFKALLENTQIEGRREVELIQKQLQIVSMNFSRKCQQIQQKEAVIHRLLHQRH